MAALIMFDLSAAFDVIDHSILLNHLELSFWLEEKALTWVKSYIADRIWCVSVADKISSNVSLHFGVPKNPICKSY